jgi:dihydroxyacetone kinase
MALALFALDDRRNHLPGGDASHELHLVGDHVVRAQVPGSGSTVKSSAPVISTIRHPARASSIRSCA